MCNLKFFCLFIWMSTIIFLLLIVLNVTDWIAWYESLRIYCFSDKIFQCFFYFLQNFNRYIICWLWIIMNSIIPITLVTYCPVIARIFVIETDNIHYVYGSHSRALNWSHEAMEFFKDIPLSEENIPVRIFWFIVICFEIRLGFSESIFDL